MEYGSIWQSQICPQVLASIIKQNVLTVGPDLQTAGEIPRDDNGNDHTSMKIALWNVNGAASEEEEINAMMRGTNASCGITCITEPWLRPWHLGVFPAHFRQLSDIGLHTYLDDLRCLSQKNVSNLELRKIRIALTVLPSIPEFYCLSAL